MGFVTVVAGVVGIMYIIPGAGTYLWIMGMVGMCLGVVVLRSWIRAEQQMYSGWGVTGTYHRGRESLCEEWRGKICSGYPERIARNGNWYLAAWHYPFS